MSVAMMGEKDAITIHPNDHSRSALQEEEEEIQLRPDSQCGEPTTGSRAAQEEEFETRRSHIPHEFSFAQLWSHIKRFRLLCGAVVNHEKVQMGIVTLIGINAIMMGVATFDFVMEDPQVEHIFEQVDQAFLIVFTIELALQLIYHGFKLFLDGWLVFDFVIIVASWSLSSVQIIRAFRIFRALRLITRIKMMKNLVLAVFSVMPRMNAIGLLLGLIFYIFAVMMTQLFKDMYQDGLTEEDYFSNLGISFFTLFQIMTLDDWANISRQVIEVYFWAWVLFFVFVTISGFIVVNLIIAVICDAVATLTEDTKAKIHGSYDEDDEDDSSEMRLKPSRMSEHLKMLEDQIDELARSQEQMLQLLERRKGNSLDGSTQTNLYQ
ncbi:hypothetical protein MHU86_12776 [Fragilaria crotonensis]|nr:hypothetical protein MHU86_12776 [Fragilaria crotonensis]